MLTESPERELGLENEKEKVRNAAAKEKAAQRNVQTTTKGALLKEKIVKFKKENPRKTYSNRRNKNISCFL